MGRPPSARPDLFSTPKAQEKERQRLFKIIEELVQWENTNNEKVLEAARREIWESWRRACAENADHPRAKELFDRNKLPAFHDPFAGGGAIPLEAQRLGLEAYASDLNPVAVLINKAMIEIPPKFSGKPPVNPDAQKTKDLRNWKGAEGLAEDVRYYGQWMRDEAEKRIGHLYPRIEITEEMAKERKDLKPLVGQKLTVIAWLWARTVRSPNPAFATIDVPLASTFMLSTKPGLEAFVQPVVEKRGYRFAVHMGKPRDLEATKSGTKLARGANFRCVMSETPISGDYIKAEGKAGRMGVRLMAVVAEGVRGRVYLAPTEQHETAATRAKPEWRPELSLPNDRRNFWTVEYGLTSFGDLFTDRQLVALTNFSDLIKEVKEHSYRDALLAGEEKSARPLREGGRGATAYAEAVATLLGFGVSKSADYWSSICTWRSDPKNLGVGHVFARQAIPMAWDFAEGNPLSNSSGNFSVSIDWIVRVVSLLPALTAGIVSQCDAQSQETAAGKVVSTDPPYYDNVAYADLSDFFYVWLRRSLRELFPDVFATVTVPKAEELVATPYRHGGSGEAEEFFLKGMTAAMRRLAEQAHGAFPVTIYYAFKQAETEGAAGTASTGWETFLDAVIRAGFGISGTWPVRTELGNRTIGKGTNALASSIVLVCRTRTAGAPTATRREFVAALQRELPEALRNLQAGNIAPVDLAQAALGPGMAVFTRYAKVLDAQGNAMRVREALSLINETLDAALAEQEGDFDSDSRWAVTWFEEAGFKEGEYGRAEQLSKSKNTSVEGMKQAGILASKAGKVRLLKPDELPDDWDPATDPRLTTWEMAHHLIRVLADAGEAGAADLMKRLGAKAEPARELAYRLYTICERKKRAAEAQAYNGLVQSWPEIWRLAREAGASGAKAPEPQTKLL
jgi:putative DNA methylase